MILPGRSIIARKIVHGAKSPALQSQPCGVDLTLQKVLTWTSHGSIDFDNSLRQTARTQQIPFNIIFEGAHGINLKASGDVSHAVSPSLGGIHLPLGSYLVQFNERVSVPLDAMGQIFVRSSLFRSGALLNAGVMDSGYKGSVGALLQVVNPLGLQLFQNARLAQLVFHQMSETVVGYNGTYQGSSSLDET